ncbi:MAG: hypothetical protein Q9227_004973 [Pyrenula ochraceoflavens]
MSRPILLPSLTPREAVADAMYRALLAFDRNDLSLFTSAFAPGESTTIELNSGERRTFTGLSTIRSELLDHVGPMDTSHTISNMRVWVEEGKETAAATGLVMAQHCPPGRGREVDGPKYLACGEVEVEFVWDGGEGVWKVKRWVHEVIWRQGDPGVMRSQGELHQS